MDTGDLYKTLKVSDIIYKQGIYGQPGIIPSNVQGLADIIIDRLTNIES